MLRTLLCTGLSAAIAGLAVASPLTYAFRPTPIRAGVVIVDSQQIGTPPTQANYAPYVLYNLDANRNIKPGGWTFYNPSAPTRVTPEIKTRWDIINDAYGAAPSANVGEPIGKRNGAYWEVRLSTASESQLSQYDFLVLSSQGYVSLNPLEREKLRRFMEGGGVLWVDFTSSSNFEDANGLPLGFGLTNVSLNVQPFADFDHPLMRRPNPVNASDLTAMDAENILSIQQATFTTQVARIQQPTAYEFNRFQVVTQDIRGPKIACGQVGEGWIVVTSRGVSRVLNRAINSAGGINPNLISEAAKPSFERTGDAAARLAINMIYLTASANQVGKGPRKLNSSILDLGAPLFRRFEERVNMNLGGTARTTQPAVFKGLAIVSTRNRILVYDANPSSDLNADGNPDDGVADYSVGSDRDLVWASVVLGDPISPPTAVQVPDSAIPNQITVIDGQGNLAVFNAFPTTPSLAQVPDAIVPPPSPIDPDFSVPGGGPYAPTFHDGQYFIADQILAGFNATGRVWLVDATSLSRIQTAGPWQVGTTTTPVMGRPSGSPTVGYVPIADGSGGMDRVVYVPTRANTIGGPNSTAGFHSFWLGAKGEKPIGFVESGGSLFVNPRCANQNVTLFSGNGPHPLGIKLTVLDQLGNPLSETALDNLFTGNVTVGPGGQLSFEFETGQSLPANHTIRIDYTIDWGVPNPGYGLQLLRGQIFLPDDSNRRRRILGNLALSPEGVIHLVHSDDSPATPSNTRGGCYYAFREDVRGVFKMLSRYELYGEHTIALNQAAPVTYRETFVDNDPVTQIPGIGGFLGGRFRTLRFVSGPTIHNGTVFVMAQGTKVGVPQGFIPFQIVLAFDANPRAPEIVVGDLAPNFQLLQPDIARSDNKTTPNVLSVLSAGNFTYERESGASNGVIRFESLMQNPRGSTGNSFSLSQPIVLRIPGRPDAIIEPNRTSNRWSPLLWYMVQHGFNGSIAPVASGNTVFWIGSSALPWFVRNGFLAGIPVPTPVVFGMDAEIAPNSAFLATDGQRPWQKQLYSFQITPTFRGNPAIRWPQNEGAQDFDDWAIRLLQTEVGGSQNAVGLGGGEDTLIALGDGAVTGFRRADFIVCDEGRLTRFDASGNPIWAGDATSTTGLSGDFGSAIVTKPLVRPTKAYIQNAREMYVVDTGGNRIIRLDQSGRETRSIEGFRLDPNFTPNGFSQTHSMALKEPRDVLVYYTYESNPSFFSNAQAREYWVHYLIADSGNKRLIELVDRYRVNATTGVVEDIVRDANNVPALSVLYWHTGPNLSGKNFDYHSLSRVSYQDLTNPLITRYVYAAGIGSIMPTRADLGLDQPTNTTPREAAGGNGGIVVFDDNQTVVINEVVIPAVGANVYWDFTAGSFTNPAQQSRRKKLGNLNSVTMRNIIDTVSGQPRVAIMFTDSEGVFEVYQPSAAIGNLDPTQPWQVRWMMTREAYKALRRTPANVPTGSNPVDFRPTFARRLDSGEVLFVNGWLGKRRDASQFLGEIVQVSGVIDPTNNNNVEGFGFSKLNLGFRTSSIKAELPPVQGTRGIIAPVFADRR